jgi:hypothetical protein
MIDEGLVDRINRRYKFRYNIFQGTDTILVDDGFYEWEIKYHPYSKERYILRHKNTRGNIKEYHRQSSVSDESKKGLVKMFRTIAQHQKKVLCIHKK